MRVTRSQLGDGALAVVLATAGLGAMALAGRHLHAPTPIDTVGFALYGASSLVLAVRRRWPTAVLAAVTACVSVYLVLGYPYGPILLVFMIALYGAARHAGWDRAAPVALAALLALLLHLVGPLGIFPGRSLGLLGVVPVTAWVIVPFSLGLTLRLRQESAARARVAAIQEERFRVAQEVHDIIGHGLAAIKMQADIALHVLAKKPDQAQVALEAISRTSSQALDELRATLTAVRRTDAALSPVPGLARLDDLRKRMADAGVSVQVETSGAPAVLPVAVDLTGYRVIQESLTNVLRHSGSGRATVRIHYAPGEVRITVDNPVAGSPGDGGGSGIPGMRDRVHALGGQFTAGSAPQHRFEVHARLPIGSHP
jgi:signal transduction histidine kinase